MSHKMTKRPTELNLDFINCDLYYFIDCFKIKFNYHLLVINHKSNFIYLYLYNFKSDFNFVYFIFLIYLMISFYLFLLIYSKIYFLEFFFIINLIHKASVQNIDSNLLPISKKQKVIDMVDNNEFEINFSNF